jgi:hypothetical protein
MNDDLNSSRQELRNIGRREGEGRGRGVMMIYKNERAKTTIA